MSILKELRGMQESELERAFDTQFTVLRNGLPFPEKYFVFIPGRRFHLDRAWPNFKVGVELQGGTRGRPVTCHNCGVKVRAKKKDGSPGKQLSILGYHTQSSVYQSDMNKNNLGQINGWTILHFGNADVYENPFEMVEIIRKALTRNAHLAGTEKLTEREIAVIQMLAGGFKAEEIGIRLGCVTVTVYSHIDRITKKLNGRNRAHVIALCAAAGLLDFSAIPWTEEITIKEFANRVAGGEEL